MGNGKFGLTDVPKSMRGDRRSPNSQFTGTWLALPARGLHEKERNATAENGFGFTGLFDTCCTPVCDFQDPLVAPGKKRTALKAYGGGANSDKRETLLATVPGVAGVDPPSEVSLACCTAVCDFPDDLHSWNKRTNAPDRHQGNSVLKNEAVLKRGGGKAAAAGELARDIQRLPEVKGQLDDTMALLRRRIREHDQANGNPHLEMSADEGNALKRLVERLDEEHKQLMARIKKNGGMSGLR